MRYPKLAGISAAYQHELIGLLDDFTATAGIDADLARRADWLKLGLQGHKPELMGLPFVADAGPLVPGLGSEAAPVA
jgi:hypothetical protein